MNFDLSNTRTLNKITFIFILIILNLFSINYSFLGIVVSLLELFFLFFLFSRKRFRDYLIYFLIFLITSLEVESFVTGIRNSIIYNFHRLPLLRTYHIYILLILPIFLVFKEGKLKINFKKHKYLKLLLFGFVLIYFFSFLSMLLSYIFNDNGILNLSFYPRILIREILSHLTFFMFIFYFIIALLMNENFIYELENWLLSILISFSLVAPVSYILGFSGLYGNEKVNLLPLSSFYGITLIIFPFYTRYKKNKSLFIFGAVMIFFTLVLPSPLGGKWWLFLFFIIIISIGLYFLKDIDKNKFVIRFLLILPFLFFTIIILTNVLTMNEILELEGLQQTKYIQAIRTLSIFERDWFSNLPASPQFRFVEFFNVMIEYAKKPQYFIFGKGLGGSIQHHTNLLDWNNEYAFSLDQIRANVFFSLHETINMFFLKFGLFGLGFLTYILYLCTRNLFKNPWIVIGMVWLLFYYGIYFSMIFGTVSLVVGLYRLEQ